jgi:hypothetical protein
MPHERNRNPLVKIIQSLGHGFYAIPLDLWIFSLLSCLVGVVFLVASKIHSPLGGLWHGLAELSRDTGIAFIIAPVVTLIFEAGTRRNAKLEEMRHYVNATMGSFVTKDVWEEIKNQVVIRNVTRRNVEIKITVLSEVLDGVQAKRVPDNALILDVEYTYELHPLTTTEGIVAVRHAVDIHMWDEELKVPCFKLFRIVEGGRTITYENTELALLYDRADGLITTEIDLPQKDQPTQITTKRLEKISFPGMYTMIMPEIMTHSDGVDSTPKTIGVSIQSLPDNIEAETTTWFAPHEFVRDGIKNEWSYNWPMLAGQGFSIVFKKPAAVADAGAKETSEIVNVDSAGSTNPSEQVEQQTPE